MFFSALVLALVLVAPGQAQFSDTWEFFNAVEDVDYLEMRTRLTRGANINSHNEDGLSAVIIASDMSNSELLQFLLDHGANINGVEESRNETALMRRTEVGDVAFLRVLIGLGADVNLQDRGGQTALMKAARYRNARAAQLLIESNANLDTSDYTGQTALDHARQARARQVEKALIKAGAR